MAMISRNASGGCGNASWKRETGDALPTRRRNSCSLAIRIALGAKVIADSHSPANLKRSSSISDPNHGKIHFVLAINRQRKIRLTKWYSTYSQKERTKVIQEISELMLCRGPELCNFLEWRGLRVVYKKYAGLFFCMCIDPEDNELETLELIHLYVKILDRYFYNVTELDLLFYFHWAYYLLDELVIAGEIHESNMVTVVNRMFLQDNLVYDGNDETRGISYGVSRPLE
ncbi:AP complex subunit sigma [Psidium guajava]|nr:AP complex subunit sigma [Psidium guajava]